MTIETGPSAQNTSRPAATESKHAKGKSGDAQGTGATGAVGFMAVLASLDTPEVATPPTDLPGDGTSPGNSSITTALAASARTADVLKGASRSGHATGSGDLSASDATVGKVAQTVASDAAAAFGTAADARAQSDVPVDTSMLLAQAAQWSIAPTVNADPNAATGSTTNFTGPAKLPHAQIKSDDAIVSGSAASDAVMQLAGNAGKTQKDIVARLASAQAALTATSEASNPAADARQAQLLQKVADTPMAPLAAVLAAANTIAPARREDAAKERSVFRSNVSEGASTVGQSYLPSASAASSITAPDPVSPTDTYVAEKVAYWITNDVHNAEMKLDGIGDKPVEVSIRMQGNEAHIAFRSDELQARAALENASIHLKDMLQREGLVLSGVSVGTAGTGDSSGQERQSRQGARQSGVVSVQPAHADLASGTGRVSGGALDLFV